MTSYYAVLNVTPFASGAEIKESFKRLALSNDPELKTQEIAQIIFEAYKALSDPDQRSAYNAWLADGFVLKGFYKKVILDNTPLSQELLSVIESDFPPNLQPYLQSASPQLVGSILLTACNRGKLLIIKTFIEMNPAWVRTKLCQNNMKGTLLDFAFQTQNPALIELLLKFGGSDQLTIDHLGTAITQNNFTLIELIYSFKKELLRFRFGDLQTPSTVAIYALSPEKIKELIENEDLDPFEMKEQDLSFKEPLNRFFSALVQRCDRKMIQYFFEEYDQKEFLRKRVHHFGNLILPLICRQSRFKPDEDNLYVLRYMLETLNVAQTSEDLDNLINETTLQTAYRIQAYLLSRTNVDEKWKAILEKVAFNDLTALTVYELFDLYCSNLFKKYRSILLSTIIFLEIPLERLRDLAKDNAEFKQQALFVYSNREFNDHLEPLQLLIEELGANVNDTTTMPGYTPLLVAIDTYLRDKYNCIVNLLVEKGADVKIQSPSDGKTIHEILKSYPSYQKEMGIRNHLEFMNWWRNERK